MNSIRCDIVAAYTSSERTNEKMTKEEALIMLSAVPAPNEPSRVNRALTQDQIRAVVLAWLATVPAGAAITYMQEKRVCQVAQNCLRPKFREWMGEV